MTTAACILSAGLSTRMGRDKALLPLHKGETFLSHIVKTIEKAEIFDIFVVISRDEIKEKSQGLKVKWIFNRNPEKGQLFSFQLCIKEIKKEKNPEIKGVLLVPVDHPFVEEETYKKLLNNEQRDKIVVVTYHGKRGHPTYFPCRFFGDILEAPLDIGARYILRRREKETIEIGVEDQGILQDIDTLEDFNKIRIR